MAVPTTTWPMIFYPYQVFSFYRVGPFRLQSSQFPMSFVDSQDRMLLLGLVLALMVIFARPIRYLLDLARDVETSFGLALVPALIILTGIAFNLACNLLFAGSGPEGLTVIGTVISLTSWLMLGLLVLAMWRSKRVPNGVLDRKAGLAVRNVLALGIPVGAIFFTETLLFTGSSLLMG